MKIESLNQQLNTFFNWTDKQLFTDISHDYSKFKGYSKTKVQEIVRKRFESRYGTNTDITIRVLKIEPAIIPTFGKNCYLIGKIIYEVEKPNEMKRKGKMILYLYSKDEIWAGVEIKDPYGYIDEIFNYVDEGVIEGKDWEAIKEDINGEEKDLKKLSSRLKGYSRISVRNVIREKLEKRYNFDPSIVAELQEIEAGVYGLREKAWVTATLGWAIKVKDREIDSPVMVLHMYSKDNIKVEWE